MKGKQKNNWIFFSLGLIFLALILFLVTRTSTSPVNQRTTAEENTKLEGDYIQVDSRTQDELELNNWYKMRYSLFKTLPLSEEDYALVGDSIIHNGNWEELTGNPRIKNRGINSDSITGIQYRIEDITKWRPQKIVIAIGVNDLFRGYDYDGMVYEYNRLVETVLDQSPTSDLTVVSILPVNASTYHHSLDNQLIIQFNEEIKAIAQNHGIEYLDAHSAFYDGNEMLSDYTTDGVHLSGEGYLLYADILQEHFS